MEIEYNSFKSHVELFVYIIIIPPFVSLYAKQNEMTGVNAQATEGCCFFVPGRKSKQRTSRKLKSN